MTVTVEFAPTARRTPCAPAATRPRPTADRAPAGRCPRHLGAAERRSCLTAAAPIGVSSAVALTRRGWAVLLGVATAVALALIWVGYLSHPGATDPAGAARGPAASGPVTVQAGDTLWSIAQRVAPGDDPRAVVWELRKVNHLADPTVVPGQVLALP